NGRFVGYVNHCLDIHDLIQARQDQARLTGELRINEERLRLAMEATRDGLWDWNIQTGKTYCNPAYFQMLGYEPGELGEDAADLWVNLLHPDERESIVRRATNLLNTSGEYEIEFRLRAKDGQYRCVSSRGKVVERAEHGAPLRAIGTHIDITERKRMERALVAKHQELEKITASIPGAVYEFERSADGRYRMPWASAVGGQLFGLDPQTIKDDIGPLFRRIYPEDLPELQSRIEVSAQTLRPFQSLYRLQPSDGTERWLQSNSNPEVKPDGGILWYGYTQDITERKQEEVRQVEQQAALRELSERLTKIAARVPGAIYQYKLRPDGSACFPYASEGIRDIYGVTPAEVHDDASPAFAMLHPDDLENVRASIEESARTLSNWHWEYRVRLADGTVRWLSGNSSPEREDDGSVLWHGYITDITDRKAAEAELRSASLYARSLIEASLDPLVTICLKGQIMDVNAATERVTGCGREQLIGSDFSRYFTEPEQARAGYLKVFAEGFVTDFPLAIRHADGHLTEVLFNASIYREEAGAVAGVFATARDVTERNRAETHIRELNTSLEEKVAERTMQLAQASAAKTEFLAHMSHEIRTPMNAILGFAQVLEREPLHEEHAQLVRHIRESGQNLLHIINDILDFSKIEAGQLRLEPAPFALDSLLIRVAGLLTASARQRGIELRVAPSPNLPGRLLGDDLRLQQILVNLTGNAIKFTEQGTVELIVKPMSLEPRVARLRFEVRDTGIGI
ncbi:MAG: PAS domain S-box protein, partial [Methylococcus sp.]